MRTVTISVLCLLLLVSPMSFGWVASAQERGPAEQQSLYKRLGGFDAIAAVTDDFIARMVGDPQLKRFFTGFNEHSLRRIREHVVDFLCQSTGGPCQYHGLDMKAAHTGLKITEQDWQAAVRDLNGTLDKFQPPQRERQEVLSAISNLKGDIVGH